LSLPLLVVSWVIVLLVASIAIRLGRVAVRERTVPEVLMALFFGGGSLGYGVLLIAPTFGFSPAIALVLRTASTTLLLLPGTTVVLFTWYVFRREAGWARALAWSLAGIAVLTHVASTWLAAPLGLGHIVSMTPGAPFYWAVTVLKASGFLWACLEASLYYGSAKKRVMLGLTHALVANRFLLWAVWSGAATAMVGIRILSAFIVDSTVAQPVTPVPILLAMFVGGLTCAGAVWLTFAPPNFYRRFIESRTAPLAA
jgi:hypothetical protein